jgi:hypothetical protein
MAGPSARRRAWSAIVAATGKMMDAAGVFMISWDTIMVVWGGCHGGGEQRARGCGLTGRLRAGVPTAVGVPP